MIGYVDADGATPPRAFLDLVKKIGVADCVIGSRWLPGAVIHQSQTGNRQFASRVFHFIVQLLFWMNIRDTQCGAKVMKREVVEKIHSRLRIADMAFDINLLFSHQARRLQNSRSADRMDGQGRLKSRAGARVADDVFIRHPHPADLLAADLQIAPAIKPAGKLALQKIARAQAVVLARKNNFNFPARISFPR